MWDNRCLLHRAMANFDGDSHRRILQNRDEKDFCTNLCGQ